MAQDYEVLDFKKGIKQDDYGNYWCSMALKGVGEPVSIAVKDPTQFSTGMTLYGTVENKVSRAGKDYLKFKREKKEEVSSPGEPAKTSWQPRDDMAIRAQWAIGQAVNMAAQVDKAPLSDIEEYATQLFAMVDRVKGSAPVKAVDETFGESEPINLDDIPY